MAGPYTGGCACGAIRYEARNEPLVGVHCQCRDCQRRSGAGHSSYLTFDRRADVTITGEARTWRVAGDSGKDKLYAFCPACGVPLYVTFPDQPEVTAIHAGSLDEPARFQPQIVTYAVRALAWDGLDPALPAFERMPPA